MAELTFHHRGETKQNLPAMHQHFADNALASAPGLLRASGQVNVFKFTIGIASVACLLQ